LPIKRGPIPHFLRRRLGAEEKLIEELADVKLMMSQIIRYFGKERIDNVIDYKSDRVKRKLNEAKEEKDGI